MYYNTVYDNCIPFSHDYHTANKEHEIPPDEMRDKQDGSYPKPCVIRTVLAAIETMAGVAFKNGE